MGKKNSASRLNVLSSALLPGSVVLFSSGLILILTIIPALKKKAEQDLKIERCLASASYDYCTLKSGHEFAYVPAWLSVGIALSVLGIVAFIFAIVFRRKANSARI